MRARKGLAASFALSTVLLGLLPAQGAGQAMYGGWESGSDRQGFGYAGLYLNGPGHKKVGSYLNLIGGYLYYRYVENNRTADVTSPSFTLTPGLSCSFSKLTVGLGLGAEYRHEKTNFIDSAQTIRNVIAFSPQLSLAGQPNAKSQANLLMSFNTGNHYFWSRLRYQAVLNSGSQKPVWPGLEIIGQGNRKYSSVQAGIIAEARKFLKVGSLLLKAGYKRSFAQGGLHPNSAYAGAELSFAL